MTKINQALPTQLIKRKGKKPAVLPRKSVKHVVKYDTDLVARNTYSCLLRDLRAVHGKSFFEEAENCLLGNLRKFRELEYPSLSTVHPSFYKAYVQMTTLLKKYRFANDYYTDVELEERSISDYFSAQLDFCRFPQQTTATKRILQEARKIAKSILGEYSEEEVVQFAKFGRKSSIGCPLALAHIDYKLSNVEAFTGTKKLSAWFKKRILAEDSILRRIVRFMPGVNPSEETPELTIESLILKTVPKSWKILRLITPLTLLGLFYSHGIGGVITERLDRHGLKISRLQQIHRLLVKKFSRTRSHVTGDLTRASDSILKEHLLYVLPRAWYVAIRPMLTHQVILTGGKGKQDVEAYTASVLPMGNGATFPLETLIFYCIIKAIGNLSGVKGVYSVYGDDLIYPTSIHPFVKVYFPILGFTLNEEKTSCEEYFRESCGADFYRGVDVRPFTFPGEHRKLTRSKYIVELYKIYNGLTRRWAPEEIRGTLFYLLKEMALTGYSICRVPKSYPDTAGIHVDYPTDVPLNASEVPFSPIWSKFLDGTVQHYFWYMSERAEKRFVLDCEPYYWLALQGLDDSNDPPYAFWQTDTWISEESPERQLKWVKFTRYRCYRDQKGKKRKKAIVRWKPTTSERMETATKRVGGSVIYWS